MSECSASVLLGLLLFVARSSLRFFYDYSPHTLSVLRPDKVVGTTN